MKRNNPLSDDQRYISSILELIRKYENGRFSERINVVHSGDETGKIAEALNALGAQLQARTEYFVNNEKRIDEILQVLMSFTMSDFSKRAEITDAGDELDAIALGLNTLAEELDAARIKEQKYIQELESANKELKSFTYLASHDLREPLRNLMMFSSIISEVESKNLSERGKQILEKIVVASSRMERLIEDLGTFSRIQTFTETFGTVDLNEIFKEIKITYGAALNSEQINIESEELPIVDGLPVQLRQLFRHLIDNSIKYRKPGNVPAEIKIHSEMTAGTDIPHPGIDKARKYLRISISDNGIGFDQKYAERIFEIFQRLHGRDKYSGTGMGLALCRKVVQNHHGFIYAIGEEGKGAVFFVCLPV